MPYKPCVFRMVDAAFYIRWLEFQTPMGETKKYCTHNFQILFGRVNKSGTVWTPVVTFIMGAEVDGQLHRLLKALYIVSTINGLSKTLTRDFGDNHDAKNRAYEAVCKLLQDDIRRNQYHVEMLLEDHLLEGGTIKQIASIRKSSHNYYAKVKFNWPPGFTPGEPPAQKVKLDISSLNIVIDDRDEKQKAEKRCIREHNEWLQEYKRKEQEKISDETGAECSEELEELESCEEEIDGYIN